MNCILDTHVLIFFGCGYDNRIGRKALDVYKDPKSKIFISQISFWEMAIKINIGKLKIPIGLKNVIIHTRQAGIETIPVPEGPANLCFGGSDKKTLFITARTSVYSLRMKVSGL